ncbi:MAG: ATP-binding protein [Promicromonosporaceae bacterium]|nr:ATP-binding protein [Promicromonosporaceae bacterium]
MDELPEGVPSQISSDPRVRIILLTGPSGSGKTHLTRRLGLPVVTLDDFYFNDTHPDLPRRFGIIDWDDVSSWDADGATAALCELAATGRAEIPIYHIPTNTRTGQMVVDAGSSPVVIAEGIFAAYLVEPLRQAGVLADAICVARPALVTFWFRLLRDLAESRKPPLTLIRRGFALMRGEPELRRKWEKLGCRPLPISDADTAISTLAHSYGICSNQTAP